MKGWIKVHESSLDRDAYIQVKSITTVYEDTDEVVAYIVSGSDHIPVTETVGEVLALIEEAEEEKSFHSLMKEMKETCIKSGDVCVGCRFFNLCNETPKNYDLDEIPEEYR